MPPVELGYGPVKERPCAQIKDRNPERFGGKLPSKTQALVMAGAATVRSDFFWDTSVASGISVDAHVVIHPFSWAPANPAAGPQVEEAPLRGSECWKMERCRENQSRETETQTRARMIPDCPVNLGGTG